MVLKNINIFFKYMFSSIIGKYWNYTIIKKEDTCDHRGSSSALSEISIYFESQISDRKSNIFLLYVIYIEAYNKLMWYFVYTLHTVAVL